MRIQRVVARAFGPFQNEVLELARLSVVAGRTSPASRPGMPRCAWRSPACDVARGRARSPSGSWPNATALTC